MDIAGYALCRFNRVQRVLSCLGRWNGRPVRIGPTVGGSMVLSPVQTSDERYADKYINSIHRIDLL